MNKPRLQTLRPRVQVLPDRLQVLRPGSGLAGKQTGQGLYTYAWKQASKRFLRAHPLCQCPDCDEGRKRVTVATVTDHIRPHRNDPALFWDESNWQAMAATCHNRKTAAEDGGFGNASKG